MDQPVDWDAAARVAGRLAPPGPRAARVQLEELVGQLRDVAGPAAEHVSRTTDLVPADGRPPADVSRVLVVDRPGWARANTQMFAVMAAPLADAGKRTTSASRLAAATQVGGVLALLAGKVLGQFDPFTPTADGRGRLLLVAPNVLHLERTMRVEPADFRLWVALHEQTHALQFAAAPWLAGHLAERSAALLGDFTDERRGDLVMSVRSVLNGGSVFDVLTEDQRGIFEEMGAAMALLEGHADHAMDEVGPWVVPSVKKIRAKFEAKRDQGASAGGAARVLRRLLGLDTKLAQYRDGARFVRAVQRDVGRGGFNAVWAGPHNLPTAAEIADPPAWVRRVHG
ncbi:zinc-dependent metalloprotease [Cellulomonas edaphi]|uniref:Zinc-dependent metalloprotease n=1 Tax=Cellulomonas edaphi TaxID=3053468 RepID=A0ABT7S482_9CELL|nr:zinc-dependent metalloprotease [Cellulomons edaphi]MDM7830432.1 zinc-dependent metalloprotease [Cellulomons edaphi]